MAPRKGHVSYKNFKKKKKKKKKKTLESVPTTALSSQSFCSGGVAGGLPNQTLVGEKEGPEKTNMTENFTFLRTTYVDGKYGGAF